VTEYNVLQALSFVATHCTNVEGASLWQADIPQLSRRLADTELAGDGEHLRRVDVSGVQPRIAKERRRPMIGIRMKPAKMSARNSFGSCRGSSLAITTGAIKRRSCEISKICYLYEAYALVDLN
jgi:hypothetical protein